MKYWRGYLTAAIFAVITGALMVFAQNHADLIDMVYPYLTRMLQTTLAEWSSGVSFCLWQLLAVVLIAALVTSLVLTVVLRWNVIQWLGWVLAVASCVFCLHTAFYGLNTYAGSIEDDMHLDNGAYTLTELRDAAAYYRDQANTLAGQLDRDDSGNPLYPDFDTLASQAGEGFHTLTYERHYAIFAGSAVPVKQLGWADMYTAMGITGFTFPLTGEAAVNPQIPAVSLPFTMCHEMAHRMCIANEGDANFAGFLACRFNSSVEFQYSAYFMAYRYCYNALVSAGGTVQAQEVASGVTPLLQKDLDDYRAFFAANQQEKATKVANQVNDTYLKTSGEESGIASYGDVCDLLVNWYLQEMVIPYQVLPEPSFDPLDETQVDISDILGQAG